MLFWRSACVICVCSAGFYNKPAVEDQNSSFKVWGEKTNLHFLIKWSKLRILYLILFFLLNLLNTVFLNNRHLLHKAHNKHTQMLAITWRALNAVCGAAGIILQFHHHHSWPKASDDVHTSSSAWRSPAPITRIGDISGGGAWRRHNMGQWPFLQSQGVFLSCTESVYPPPPPLPLMPRQGLMGTSVTSNGGPVNTNSSVYYHNL